MWLKWIWLISLRKWEIFNENAHWNCWSLFSRIIECSTVLLPLFCLNILYIVQLELKSYNGINNIRDNTISVYWFIRKCLLIAWLNRAFVFVKKLSIYVSNDIIATKNNYNAFFSLRKVTKVSDYIIHICHIVLLKGCDSD